MKTLVIVDQLTENMKQEIDKNMIWKGTNEKKNEKEKGKKGFWPVRLKEVDMAIKQRIFVKYVTSTLEDPCSKTLSWKLGRKASATTLIQTKPIPFMAT